MISQFILALHELYPEASELDICDTLWLATHIGNFPPARKNKQSDDTNELSPPANEPLQSKSTSSNVTDIDKADSPGYLYKDQTETPQNTILPFNTPAAPSLPGSLAISRVLRPLKQQVASDKIYTLNEELTAKNIAEKKIWSPILIGASRRWFDVVLIVDSSSSMSIWRRTISEWHSLLEVQGAFRNITVWSMIKDIEENPTLTNYTNFQGVSHPNRNPRELIDPSGQRLFLILSDCVSQIWAKPRLLEIFKLWNTYGHVAILQVFPQRMWNRTFLREAIPVKLKVIKAGESNHNIRVTSINNPFDKKPSNGLALPIITFEHESLSLWAKALTQRNAGIIPGMIFNLKSLSKPYSSSDRKGSTPQKRVERFRLTSSVLSRQLAVLLAAAPISLPVIQLIQKAMLPESQQVHLAEIISGGLLKEVTSTNNTIYPNSIQFDFIDGVREILLDFLPGNYAIKILHIISEYIEMHINHPIHFKAFISGGSISIDEQSRPFAIIARTVLKRMGGKYTMLAQQLDNIEYPNNVSSSWNLSLVNQEHIGTEIEAASTNSIKPFQTTSKDIYAKKQGQNLNFGPTITYSKWILYGYPEEPLETVHVGDDTSVLFEESMKSFQELIYAGNISPILEFLQKFGDPPSLNEPYQYFRYWFLRGRADIICREWDEAITAFEMCQNSSLNLTALMQIHLLRSWAYAAQEAELHQIAFSKYERLAELVSAKLAHGEEDFIQQDAYCFLCNIYRHQAYAMLWICAPGVARNILKQHAIPLLDRYQEPFDTPTTDPDVINWRELYIYTLWLLGIVIFWEVRLSDAPQLLELDLYDGYENVLIATKISRVFPEGQAWLADLYSFAAEMCLMRCELANNLGMQTMLCKMAEDHLKQAQPLRHDDLATQEGRLHALTLDFPLYELTVRKHIIFDTTNRMDDIVKELISLGQKTEGVNDPGYRLFSARCHLLLGNIEIELQKFAEYGEITHAQRAQAYLQQGLDFLNRHPPARLDGLYDRQILMKLNQVNALLNS